MFEDHIAEVKAGLPPERLLVFQVKEGWEPLCAFLDVPVPDEPFPRLNDAQQFASMIKGMQRLQYVPLVMASLLAIGAAAAFFAFQ